MAARIAYQVENKNQGVLKIGGASIPGGTKKSVHLTAGELRKLDATARVTYMAVAAEKIEKVEKTPDKKSDPSATKTAKPAGKGSK